MQFINDITGQVTERNITSNEAIISNIMLSLYKIIFERSIRDYQNRVRLSDREGSILFFISDPRSDLSDYERNQTAIWSFGFQKKLLHEEREDLQKDLRVISSDANEAREKTRADMEQWGNIIKNWDERLGGYKESVEKMTSQYNFFGLAKAFKSLIENKNNDLMKTNSNMKWAGGVALLPIILSIIATIYIFFCSQNPVEDLKNKLMLSIPAFIPFEIIVIYFFRIALKEQLSLKAQILQLELRYSVCAFIEDYARFSKEMDSDKLGKFESLIFSGITPDPMAVPGTFDGLEQLAGMLKSVGK